MRAGMNPSLEKRLRRADPTVGLMVDAIVQDREDVKKTSTGWNGADSLTGLAVKTAPQEAGVELSLNLGINLTNTTKDGNMTDLDGPPGYDDASPFFTAQVTWGGTEPPAFLLQRIKAWLDPDTGGGQNVATWIAQLYAVRTLTEVVGHSGTIEELDLVPIMDPVRATAGASAGEVTFNLQGLQVRPKQLGAPAGGSALGYPDPITILFIWAAQSDGTPATNVGWARDSAQSDKTTAGNKLEGVRLTKALGQRYTVSGATGGLPYLTLEWSSYTTATISFTAAGAGNNIDLGAAPSNGVQFIMQGFTPGGTSLKPEVNDGSGWVEVRDGDFADTDNTPTGGLDLSVTGTRVLKQQTYDIRCQLITNATTDVTPKLTELGAAEATITDFANLTTVSGGQWAVDPVTLKGEITQIAITAIRDGLNDYRDKITTLLSENDIGTIKFRVWWGASDLDRNKWFLVDVFNVRDYDPSGAAIVVTGVSALAKLKAVLPVVSASASEPYTQTNAGLQTVYDDLMVGQLGLDGQYRGPGVEDDTTTVTNEVSDSNVKVELDAIARCARGSIIASQGRVKFVQMFDDGGGTVVVFPPEELVDVRVLPGFRERRPEFFVPWNYNFTQKRYQDRVQITHTTAISKLGLTGLGNPPVLDDATARWVDSQALAEQIGQDTVKALATGLMLWSFGSTQPYPELEPGDRVTVPTERFVAKDPLAARALRGRLWVIGRVVQVSVDARRFAVWIQGYTDIFTTETAVTITKFAVPVVENISGRINESGNAAVDLRVADGLAVKIKAIVGTDPTPAQVRAESAVAVNADGTYQSGTLATLVGGQTLHVAVYAYELADGTGSESAEIARILIPFVDQPKSTAKPTVEIISTAENATQETFTLTATAGPGGSSNLQVRSRTKQAGADWGAWSSWFASPKTGVVVTRHPKRAKWIQAVARDVDRGNIESIPLETPIGGGLLFLAENGDPIRNTPWDDGDYPGRFTTTDGFTQHSSGKESGGKLTNRMYAKALAGDADTFDSVVDGATYFRTTANQRDGGGRGYNAIDAGNVLVAAGMDFSRAYTNKHLDNLGDGTTYKRTTTNQRDGGGRGYGALSSSSAIASGTTESGGKAVNRLYAKALAGDADTLDSVAEGATYKRTTTNEKTGAGRGYSAIDSGNVVVAAGMDFSRAYTNKHLDNLGDGTTYKRTTTNQRDGGGRGYGALSSSSAIASGTTESGGKAVNRMLGKTLAGDADTVDGVPEGTTYKRVAATAIDGSGQVDLSQSGVVGAVPASKIKDALALDSSNVTQASHSTSTETDLMSRTLPTLSNGDVVEFLIIGTVASSAATRTIRMRLGGSQLAYVQFTQAAKTNWSFRGKLVKDGATTWCSVLGYNDNGTMPPYSVSTLAVNLSGAILKSTAVVYGGATAYAEAFYTTVLIKA